MKRIARLAIATALCSALPFAVRPVGAGSDVWTTNGPYGGAIAAIAIDPNNPAVLFAATRAGVFKSTDGATNWTASSAGLTSRFVDALAIDLDGTLYAGTGDGVSRSTDEGANWVSLNSGHTSVISLALAGTTPPTLYAGTSSGLLRTTDGGASWTAIQIDPATSFVAAVAVDAANPTVVYAGTFGGGMFKSANGGSSWAAVNGGLTNRNVRAIAIDPADTAIVNVATDGGGIFRTKDGGGGWTAVNNGLDTLAILSVKVDLFVPTTLYAGSNGGGIFKTLDAGGSWSAVNAGLTNGVVSALAVDPDTPAVHAGTANGVFQSRDGGGSWIAASQGLVASDVTSVAIDPQNPATIYSGTNSGLFKSIDSGDTWTALDPGSDGPPASSLRSVVVDPMTPTTLYATGPLGVFKSVDAGVSWRATNEGLTESEFGGYLYSVTIDPQTPATLYALSGTVPAQLFKTTNGGDLWVRMTSPYGSEVSAIVVDPHVSTTLYAATFFGIRKSLDGGATWNDTGLGPTSRVFELAIDSRAPGTLYAYWLYSGICSTGHCSDPPKLSKTTDGGANWSETVVPIQVSALAIDPQTSAIYAAGSSNTAPATGAVIRSTDGGAHWTALSDGLSHVSAFALAIDPQATGNLYVGTTGGVFGLTVSPRFTLTVSRAGLGAGSVTSSPAGINCRNDCTEPYVIRTSVTLTARPALGSLFLRWNGCDSVSGFTCTIAMTRDRSAVAYFIGIPLTLQRP